MKFLHTAKCIVYIVSQIKIASELKSTYIYLLYALHPKTMKSENKVLIFCR